MKKLIQTYVKQKKWQFFFVFLLTICVQSQSVFVSYIIGYVIDGLTNADYDLVLRILMIATLVMVTITLLSTIQQYFSDKLQLLLQQDMKLTLYEHIFKRKRKEESEPASTICEKVNADTKLCARYYAVDRIQAFINAIMLVVISLLLFSIDWRICLLLLVLAVINVLVYMLTYQKLFTVRKSERDTQTRIFSNESMWLSKWKLIKLENLYPYASTKLKKSYMEGKQAFEKSRRISSLFNFFCSLLSSLSLVAIIFISMLRIQKGQITIGEFIIAFNFYSMLTGFLSDILNFGSTRQEFNISCVRLDVYLASETEQWKGRMVDTINTIHMKNIAICYGEQAVLEHFSYTFQKGNIYVLKGSNGSGKSSLLDVISGLLMCDADVFSINEIPFDELNILAYRKQHIAYAMQTLDFIDGSVSENIVLDSDRDEHHVFTLNYLENKQIKDDNISGGEKRKVVLNRAFTKTADVYLLDEPESFLDAKTREELLTFLTTIKEDHIILITSHADEFSTIADAVIELPFAE